MTHEVRERFESMEGRMDRVEANLLQISETMKEFSQGLKDTNVKLNEFSVGLNHLRDAQGRTEQALTTLLDALLTQRGNGHSKQ